MKKNDVYTNRYYTNEKGNKARTVFAINPTNNQEVAYQEIHMGTGEITKISVVCGLRSFLKWVTRPLTDEEMVRLGINKRGAGYHYHQCYNCGRVWSHNRHSPYFGDNTEEHTCPCGEQQYKHYRPQSHEQQDADRTYDAKLELHSPSS